MSLPYLLPQMPAYTLAKFILKSTKYEILVFLGLILANSECLNEEFIMYDCGGNSWLIKSDKSLGELNLVFLPWRKMTKPCPTSAPGKDFRIRKKELQILKIAPGLYFNFEDSTIPLNSAQYLNQNASILKALSEIASGWKIQTSFSYLDH